MGTKMILYRSVFLASLPYLTLISLLIWNIVYKLGKDQPQATPPSLQKYARFSLEPQHEGSQTPYDTSPRPLRKFRSLPKEMAWYEKQQNWKIGKASVSGWRRLYTAHYTIFSNTSLKKMRRIGFYLEKFYEFVKTEFPDAKDPPGSFKIRYFRTRRQWQRYARYARLPRAAAIFDPEGLEILLGPPPASKRRYFIKNLLHEATHQWLAFYAEYQDHLLPYSIHEGIAEYISCKITSLYQIYKRYPPQHQAYIYTLRSLHQENKLLSISQLLELDQRTFYAIGISKAYAQSWALITFINHKGLWPKLLEQIRNRKGLKQMLEPHQNQWERYIEALTLR
jgi:hypothetical protein